MINPNCTTQEEEEESGGGNVSVAVNQGLVTGARRRLISKKGGRTNVKLENTANGDEGGGIKDFVLRDMFTGAIDMPWRYTLLLFASSFLATWLWFALLWWCLLLWHGDLEPENLPGGHRQTTGNFTPCVSEIYSFASCYLFSLETQHTIGYGSRQTTEECPLAIILMSIQSIVGVLSTSCVAGIVFAKLARPKNRVHTVAFSKNALVKRVGDLGLCLVLRVANMRRSHLIEAHVRAVLFQDHGMKQEGALKGQELKISTSMDGDEDRALLLLPVEIYHQINEESPFYEMSQGELARSNFELVVTLEGVVEPSGNSVQARTSYLPHEILWGYNFKSMTTSSKSGYLVDFSHLNAVEEETLCPLLSAKDLREKRPFESLHKRQSKSNNNNHDEDWSGRMEKEGRHNLSFSPA